MGYHIDIIDQMNSVIDKKSKHFIAFGCKTCKINERIG